MLSEKNNHYFSTPTTGLCIARKEKKTLENMRNFLDSTLLPETYTRSVAHGRVEEEVSSKSLLKFLKLLVKTP